MMIKSVRPAVHALSVVLAIAGLVVAPANNQARAAPQNAAVVNRGVVELETGPSEDLSVKIAGEISSIIDDGATRRVVPVVGKGPLQNLIDLKYLHGIDLAIVQADAIDYARQQNLLYGLDSLTYVAKLYNEEFHLLARPDIRQSSDLNGQVVDVDVQGSGTAITTTRLFDLLHIKAKLATDTQAVALQKLRHGDIAAVAFVATKPTPLFQTVNSGDGLHLLSIPLPETVTAAYAPTQITAADYPNIVPADHPVDTIAVGNVLMAADLRLLPERDRNLTNFIDTFFTNFQGLTGPGYDRTWKDVNLAAVVPGLVRNPAAEEWLRSNSQIAGTPNPEALKVLFSRFIDDRRQASGGAPMSATDKNLLFQQFEAWQRGKAQ